MPVFDEPVVLPRPAFLTAWRLLDLGEAPAALGTGRHQWLPAEAARELEERTMRTLTGLGLARHRRLNDLWRTSLRTLAHAEHEFYAWTTGPGGEHGAVLVAARGEDAVRLVADDVAVLVEPVRPARLAAALLDGLPELDAADVPDQVVPVSAGPLREPRAAVHQLYTARRHRGARIRSNPATALDLDRGRVLTYPAGADAVVLAPGTRRAIVALLDETHAGLG